MAQAGCSLQTLGLRPLSRVAGGQGALASGHDAVEYELASDAAPSVHIAGQDLSWSGRFLCGPCLCFKFALLSSHFQVNPTHSLHTTTDKLLWPLCSESPVSREPPQAAQPAPHPGCSSLSSPLRSPPSPATKAMLSRLRRGVHEGNTRCSTPSSVTLHVSSRVMLSPAGASLPPLWLYSAAPHSPGRTFKLPEHTAG